MTLRIASLTVLAAAIALLCCRGAPRAAAAPPGPPAYDTKFGQHWHDGKAELAGYDLVFPRYGQLRKGTSVAIFVTEPFNTKTHVKPEDPKRGDVEVIKLNLVHDFATGIYDYNLMTSVFVATGAVGKWPAGVPLKISFSAQEWCGHVYAQARFDAQKVAFASHSYFEGEADQQGELAYPKSRMFLAEDALPLWARGLAGPVLRAGQETELPLLRSLQRARLQHEPLRWDRVRLSREPGSKTIEVPAGSFEVERLQAVAISQDGGQLARWLFEVDKAWPHRIVRFSRDDGLKASLRGAARLPYWQLQSEPHTQLLDKLGLRPRPAAMP